ncbi:MAG TPA: hypothetical protein DCZ95_17355 [Verrucomicrobia bacterium]|nr:MAG: hypothetical protein A2X46_17425 [Lentisphaerae bacterium GWF2_57_35]HBA85853.1 hypothetical protein [Verrucomicrobiota bacterium]
MSRVLTIARVVWLEMIRRKDLYVLLILLAALLMVLISVNVYGLGSVARYVKDVGFLLTWLCAWFFAIGAAGRQLPQEEARGTIYSLLAKPVTRIELLLGKWFGAWTIAVAATAVFYLLVMGVTHLRGGHFVSGSLIQAFLLHAVNLGMVTALALAFSTRTTYGAAASLTYVTTLASFVLAPQIPVLLTQETGIRAQALLVLYYALPHFELFDLRQRVVHDWGAAPWSMVSVIVVYGILWIVVFLGLAWFGYRRKRFSRGAQL